MLVSNILKNKVLLYLSTRYLTYGVQFVTSLVIAAKLGPYYMGIWGFILLLLNYFQLCNLGISNSFNILYVHNKEEERERNAYVANSMVLVSYLSIVVLLIFVYQIIWGIPLLDKYNMSPYFCWICVISILQYFQNFLINVFRVKNLLNYVTFCQSIIVLLNFISIFFFEKEMLVKVLAGGYLMGYLLSIVLAFTMSLFPKGFFHLLNLSYQRRIIEKGLLLFLYNTCFYFIIISIRSFISGCYEVEEFGMFTFSFTLAHAIMLLLESLSFIVFPKIVNKLSSSNTDEVINVVKNYRRAYVTSSHMLIYIALICFPIVLHFIPKYSTAITGLNLIALTILINTNGSGFSEVLISRNKEKYSAIISVCALIFNCLLAYILVYHVRVSYSYVIVATLITYMGYTFAVTYFGLRLLGQKSLKVFVFTYFSFRLFIPYLTALTISLLNIENVIFLPLLLFLVLNYKGVMDVVKLSKKVLFRPDVVNL